MLFHECFGTMRKSKLFVIIVCMITLLSLTELFCFVRESAGSGSNKYKRKDDEDVIHKSRNKESFIDFLISGNDVPLPYPHRTFLPRARRGSEFPHWQLLTDRPRGITRQQVLSTATICADLMGFDAKERMERPKMRRKGNSKVLSKEMGWNATLGNKEWFLLSPTGRLQWLLTRYGCDWYQVVALRGEDDKVIVTGLLESLGAASPSSWSSKVMKAISAIDPATEEMPDALTIIAESPHWVDVGVTNARISEMVLKLRSTDVKLEAEWLLSGDVHNHPMWFVPTPSQFVALSPTSPLLMFVLSDDMYSYHNDRKLPDTLRFDEHAISTSDRSSAEILLKSLAQARMASVEDRRNLLTLTLREVQGLVDPSNEDTQSNSSGLVTYRSKWSMRDRYKGLLGGHGQPPPPPATQVPNKPKKAKDSALHTTGQLAATLRNRVVRLSPSANPFFEESLIEGMRRAEGTYSTNGILSRAPPQILSSPTDAIAGHWNMSDLPPWLAIPAAVNVANCLDPMNQQLSTVGTGTYDPLDDLFEPQRSILIVGSSHARNLFTQICSSYIFSRSGRVGPFANLSKTFAFDLHKLCKPEAVNIVSREELLATYPQGSTIGDPFSIAYCSTKLSYFSDIESCARRILQRLGYDSPQAKKDSEKSTFNPIHSPLANKFPHFAYRAAQSKQDSEFGKPFSYSRYLLNELSDNEMQALKGVFSHIIFLPGPWELIYQDQTIAEQTENVAIMLDLLEELFAPREKILLYNLHSFHVYSHVSVDPTNAMKDVREQTVPSFAGISPESRKRNDIPLLVEEDLFSPTNCRNPFRSARYRDAQLLATSMETRDRIRAAWHQRELLLLNQHKDSQANITNQPEERATLRRRAPTEVIDFLPATTQSLAQLFVDHQGHHYRDIVLEAMSQRLLRDHVCPPQFVLAVRPKNKQNTPLSTSTSASQPLIDYAGLKNFLPTKFPFPRGVDTVYLRVRSSLTSASEMPSLRATPTGEKEILDLFPLLKLPTTQVYKGLFSAVFEDRRALRGEGAMAWLNSQKNGTELQHVMGTLNQYDPFSVSPHCACFRTSAYFRSKSKIPVLEAMDNQIRDALSTDMQKPTAMAYNTPTVRC